MKQYNCDICLSIDKKMDRNNRVGYYSFNSTYGYCDKPECIKEAKRRLRADIQEQIDTGRPDIAQEILGDECLSEWI